MLFFLVFSFLILFLWSFYVYYVCGAWEKLSSCCKSIPAKDCEILGRSHLLVVNRFQFNGLFLLYFSSDCFFLRRIFYNGLFLKVLYSDMTPSPGRSFRVRFRLFFYSHPIELYSESPYFIGLYDVESTKTHAAPVP